MELEQCYFFIEFELRAKNVSEMGPRFICFNTKKLQHHRQIVAGFGRHRPLSIFMQVIGRVLENEAECARSELQAPAADASEKGAAP